MEVHDSGSSGNASGNLSQLDDHEKSFYDIYGYEYDYDAFVTTPLAEVIPVGLVYGLIFLFGVVGNALVVFSIAYFRRMRSVTNIFLLSLASTDLLVVLLCLPIKMAAFFTFTWDFGEFLCKFVHYMQNVCLICSVGTLTVISVERFIAVMFPLQAKSICTMRHALILVLVIWLASFVLAVPIIFGRVHYEVGVVRKGLWCVKEWSEQRWTILYEMYMLIVIFIGPFFVMFCSYLIVCVQVWRVSNWRSGTIRNRGVSTRTTSVAERRRDTPSSEGGEAGHPLCSSHSSRHSKSSRQDQAPADDTKKQVVIMLMVIVLIFAICWFPILITEVLIACEKLYRLDPHVRIMRISFFLLSYLSSCVNPVIYAFMSRNFRETFKEAVCGCAKGCSLVHVLGCIRAKMGKRANPVRTTFTPSPRIVKKENGSLYTYTSRPTEEVELQRIG